MSQTCWRTDDEPVPYLDAQTRMERIVASIVAGQSTETVWLLEHPPVYTAGTSAHADELLNAGSYPVYRTGRGGRYTFHGPGQRVAYVMLDLGKRGHDIRAFVNGLESWIINTLAVFGIVGERRCGRVGIWVVDEKGDENKVAAIGVRVRRWVTSHGIAINIDPDLDAFKGIVPCGVHEHGVTSMKQLGLDVEARDVDQVLRQTFDESMPGVCGSFRRSTAAENRS